MFKNSKMSLSNAFCRGQGAKYYDTVCDFFEADEDVCVLLRQLQWDEFLSKCRADPHEHIHVAVKWNLGFYLPDVMDREYIISNIEPLAYLIRSNLTSNEVKLEKGFTLKVFIGYIRKAARHEAINLLRQERILIRKRCSNCEFLSESGYCQRDAVISVAPGPAENEENPLYGKKMGSNTSCDWFKPKRKQLLPLDSSHTPPDYTTPDKIENLILFQFIERTLKERWDRTKHPDTKRIRKRHCLIIEHLYKLLDELDLSSAKKEVARLLETDRKTIENDLKNIQSFLQKEIARTN